MFDRFKETEIGPIPVDWDASPLGEIAETTSGGTPSRKKPEHFGGTIPWVKSGELNDSLQIRETEETITKLGLAQSSAKLFPEGTLLVAMYGATAGKVGILGMEASTNQAVCAVFPSERALREYLFYALIYRRSGLLVERYGGAQPNISQRVLRAFQIPLPPLPEQRRIAHVLSTIQRAIAAQDDLIAAARETKRSLMHRLFTYGPGPEPAPTKETEIGEMPEQWEVVQLKTVAKIGNGSTPKRTNLAYWEGGTIPWLTSGKVHEVIIRQADEFVTELAQEECHLPLVQRGSIVVAITGQGKTLGNAALVTFDTCINQHLAYIQFRAPHIIPELALAFLQQRYEDLRQASRAGGSTKGALTCGFLKNYPLPLPPLEEQREIAHIISIVHAKVAAEQQRKSALEALFQSTLQQLMTGQIRLAQQETQNHESGELAAQARNIN